MEARKAAYRLLVRRTIACTQVVDPVAQWRRAAFVDSLCEKPIIEKLRFVVIQNGCGFEIDEFHGDATGRVLAEVELTSGDPAVELLIWIGEGRSKSVSGRGGK
jgi:CYTH domain-containing protein